MAATPRVDPQICSKHTEVGSLRRLAAQCLEKGETPEYFWDWVRGVRTRRQVEGGLAEKVTATPQNIRDDAGQDDLTNLRDGGAKVVDTSPVVTRYSIDDDSEAEVHSNMGHDLGSLGGSRARLQALVGAATARLVGPSGGAGDGAEVLP